MIQAFSHIFNFFNIAFPCGDMSSKLMWRLYKLDHTTKQSLRENKSSLGVGGVGGGVGGGSSTKRDNANKFEQFVFFKDLFQNFGFIKNK
jgi:hypothetical protein